MDIEELIERIKEGDNVALGTLYETYAPMMRNVCVNITNEDEDIVNDLVQMAFYSCLLFYLPTPRCFKVRRVGGYNYEKCGFETSGTETKDATGSFFEYYGRGNG